MHQILYCTSEWAKEECAGYFATEGDQADVVKFYQCCKHHIERYAE